MLAPKLSRIKGKSSETLIAEDVSAEKKPSVWSLAIVVGMAMSLGVVSTEIYLANLPLISRTFMAPEHIINLTISFHFISLALSGLLTGVLCRFFSKKKLQKAAIAIFVLGSIFCTASFFFSFFLVGRIIQGVGAGISQVIGIALLKKYCRESFSQSVGRSAFVGESLSLIAPLLGVLINYSFGWRYAFLFVGVLAIITLFLAQYLFSSLEDPYEINESPKKISHHLLMVLKNKEFLRFSGVNAFCNAILWTFAALAPFICQMVFSMKDITYAAYYAFFAGCYASACFYGGRKTEKLFVFTKLILFIAFLLMLITGWYSWRELFLVSGVLLAIGCGFIYSPATHYALQNVPKESVDIASSLMITAKLVVSACCVFVASLLYRGYPINMIYFIGILMAIVFYFFTKPQNSVAGK